MTPVVILVVLVAQIIFAGFGALLWYRSSKKLDSTYQIPGITLEAERDTSECIGLLSKISRLLVSHQGILGDYEGGGGQASEKQVKKSREITCELGSNVERLDVVLGPYDDVYMDERAQLKDYAGRAESLQKLMARDNSGAPEVEQKLLALVKRMQRENQELRATVEKCESEISDLIIRAIRSDRDARVDPLTRLPNRRAWTERKEALAMDQSDYCVAVLDLDNFKTINDTYGHAAGDAILRLVAKILREAVHATVYRNGGDEFVVLQNSRSLDEAYRRMEQLRQRVEKASVYHEGKNLSITCTLGIAYAIKDEPLESTLARADEALYEAKRKGRNCVEIHQQGVAG